jgi:hypothetical protein
MKGRYRLDDRADRFEAARCVDHRIADRPVEGQAPAAVQQQADPQPPRLALEVAPRQRLVRQAHRVAHIGLRQHVHQGLPASSTVRVIGPATRPA